MIFTSSRSIGWFYCRVQLGNVVTSFRWRRGEIDYRRIRSAARKRFLEWVVNLKQKGNEACLESSSGQLFQRRFAS